MLLVGVGDQQLHAVQLDGGVLELHGIGIQEDRVVLFAHGGSELVHDTAVHAVVVVLGILSDQRQLFIGDLIETIERAKREAGHDFKSRGRGKTRAVGDITVNGHVKTAVQLVAAAFESPYNSLGIIRPLAGPGCVQIINHNLGNACLRDIDRSETELSVLSLLYSSIGADIQRAGKYMTAVVICMLTDQIDTAGGEKYSYAVRSPISLFKAFQYDLLAFQCHITLFSVPAPAILPRQIRRISRSPQDPPMSASVRTRHRSAFSFFVLHL